MKSLRFMSLIYDSSHKSPIDRLLQPVDAFIKKDYSGGLVLFLAVIAALIWANGPWSEYYHHLWHEEFGLKFGNIIFTHSLHVWINDGLMAIFFFLIGLELKREFMAGELSSLKKAALPLIGAVGGMIVPALIYVAINYGEESINGWGIPMATDIAFALAILALVGKGVPLGVKVFLSALAVADDLGAVLVIAFFYTDQIFWFPLIIGFVLLIILFIANMMGVRSTLIYTILIIAIWICFLMSGVHATIAGVLAAFCIPARTKIDEQEYSQNMRTLLTDFDKEIPINSTLTTPHQHQLIQDIKQLSQDAETPLQKLEHSLHNWVIFFIMPLFALSNAGIHFSGDILEFLKNPISLGIMLGLIFGKFMGVLGFTFLFVKLKVVNLPSGAEWKHIAGVSLLAGVGFTMSMFISNLAFANPVFIEEAKYGILFASLIAGILGFFILNSISKKDIKKQKLQTQ